MPPPAVAEPPRAAPKPNGQSPEIIHRHKTALIIASPFNAAGREPDEEMLASVRAHGIIQPLLARPKDGTRIELIAGERRWKSALKLKLDEVPVIIRQANDTETIELQTIENEQRKDLSPIEQAEKYQQGLDQYAKEGFTGEKGVERLAAKIGKGKSTIYDALRLLKLPAKVKESIAKKELPASHAGLLLKLDSDPNAQERVLKAIRQPQSWEAEEFNGAKVLSFRNTKAIVEDELRLAKARDKWRELAATHKKKGGKVLGEEGMAVTFEYRQKHGYVSEGDWCYDYSQSAKTYGSLMGKHAPISVLAHDQNWQRVDLYLKKDATAAAEKNGHKKRTSSTPRTRSVGSRRTDKTAKEAEAQRQTIENIRTKRESEAFEQIVNKAESTSGESSSLYLWILEQLWNISGFANTSLIGKRLGFKPAYSRSQAILKKLKGKTAKSLRGITILALMPELGEYCGSQEWDPEFVSACKTFGVKVPEYKVEQPKKEPVPDARKIKGLTAAGRKRLSGLMKARWTGRQNKKGKAKK